MSLDARLLAELAVELQLSQNPIQEPAQQLKT